MCQRGRLSDADRARSELRFGAERAEVLRVVLADRGYHSAVVGLLGLTVDANRYLA
jgi:hypothetical protein